MQFSRRTDLRLQDHPTWDVLLVEIRDQEYSPAEVVKQVDRIPRQLDNTRVLLIKGNLSATCAMRLGQIITSQRFPVFAFNDTTRGNDFVVIQSVTEAFMPGDVISDIKIIPRRTHLNVILRIRWEIEQRVPSSI